MKNRLLAAVLAVATALSCTVIAMPIHANEADTALWTDAAYVDTSFAGGTGTADDPYKIATAGQLALLAKLTNANTTDSKNNAGKKYASLCYELVADIDASAHQWVPIGNSFQAGVRQFTGTLNGNGYTVTTVLTDNSAQTGSTSESAAGSAAGGLFGRAQSATVTDLKLKTTLDLSCLPAVTNGYIGGLGGALAGCTVSDCHVEITADGTVSTSSKPSYRLGGIAGYTGGGSSYWNCSVSGRMRIQGATASGSAVTTLNTQYVGGLFGCVDAGGNTEATYSGCINYADLCIAAGNSHAYVGGFAAELASSTGDVHRITNFINAGNLTVSVVHVNAKAKQHIASVFGATGTEGSVELTGCISLGKISYVGRSVNTTDRASAAELIANNMLTDTTANAKNTVENCYTVHPLTPALFNYSGTAPFGDVVTSATVRDHVSLDGLKNIVFETSESGNTTSISLDADLLALLTQFGTVAAGRGSKNAVECVKNETKSTYEYTVEDTDGIAFFTLTPTDPDLAPITVFDKWEYRAEAIASGSGSTDDPYLIYTAEELASLIAMYDCREGTASAKHYRLEADIDLSEREWSAIGSYLYRDRSDLRFKGTFDGNGKTVSGLTVTGICDSDAPAALFGAVMKDSAVSDFTLEASIRRVSATGSTAAVCAYASDTAEFTNLDINADISVTGTANALVGGILADAVGVTIASCSVSGRIKATDACVGGMVARTDGTAVTGCVNAATLSHGGAIVGCNIGADTALTGNYAFTLATPIGEDTADAALTDNHLYSLALETLGGAAVRIDQGALSGSGLRFDSTVDLNAYHSILQDGISVSLGMLIAPTALFDAFRAAKLPAAVKVPYPAEDYATSGRGVQGFFAIEDGACATFTGAVTNLMLDNYNLSYTATAYAELTLAEKTYTVYAPYDGDAARSRSIVEVARAAYDDRSDTAGFQENGCCYGTDVGDGKGYSCYSTAQLEILKHYLAYER